MLILSSIDKPAVCLREWENPGPSEEPLFTRPVHCSLLKPRGTWWVTDLSQTSRAAASLSFMCFSNLFFCSCYSALVFLIFVFTSMFISASAICLSLSFFFFPLLCLAVSHFEQRPIKKNKREELNNSKMSCY